MTCCITQLCAAPFDDDEDCSRQSAQEEVERKVSCTEQGVPDKKEEKKNEGEEEMLKEKGKGEAEE